MDENHTDAGLRARKKEMRREIRRRIGELSLDQRAREADRSAERLFELPEWRDAATVLVFVAMKGEIGTRRIIDRALAERKRIGLPRMHGDSMHFHMVAGPGDGIDTSKQLYGELSLHPYGILEPAEETPVFDAREELLPAVVITPGLGFDRKGGRLGRGKGFYDGWFGRHEELLSDGSVSPVAVGYSVQLVEEVPTGRSDRRVPLIVIDGELIRAE
jgi:5-formyltetrahydrofolate cyclo-ligase